MSFAELSALTSAGMPGVWTWGFSDGWEHCFLDSIGVNHNSIGRGYETFGNGTAETVERVLRPNEERYAGRPATSQEWYRPMPPPRKFMWSLRNNTNYMESGCLAALDYAAKHSKEMLRDFYRKGYNSWQKGVKGGPYAFAIAEDQGDRRRVADMIDLLIAHGIEVGRATAPFKVAEGEFAAGTYVVRLDQPYRGYAVDLLTPQTFPTDAVYDPYDDVSWALTVHYGLEAKRIDDAKIMDAAAISLAPVAAGVKTQGAVNGQGPVFLIKDVGQEGLLALRARLAAFRVEIAEKAFKAGEKDYPAGSWIIADQKGLADALGRAAAELAIDCDGVAAVPEGVARHESKLPRVAVWHTWADTEAVGWIRFVFDREKVPYAYIRDEDIRAGRLRDKYDVIIFGHNYLGLQDQIHGIDKKFGPMAYTKTKETPEPGRARCVGGHHRRHRLARDGQDRGIPGRGRRARHAGQRLGARARGRAGEGRRPEERGVLHARKRAQGQVHAAGPPAGLRFARSDVRLPQLGAGLRHRQGLAGERRDAVGHEAQGRGQGRGEAGGGWRPGADEGAEGREGSSQESRGQDARQRRAQGRGRARRPAGDHGYPGGQGPRRCIQFQPDPPRPQPVRPPFPLERPA